LRRSVFAVCRRRDRRQIAPDHASISIRLPLTPEADRIEAALLAITDANVGTPLAAELVDVFVEGAVELLVALDAVLVAALVEAAAVDVFGAVGMKLLLPTPKPRTPASLPLPCTVTSSVLFRPVMTNLPPALIDAVTKAPPELMALIRSPTESVPVEA
jgi:hypothetical protein